MSKHYYEMRDAVFAAMKNADENDKFIYLAVEDPKDCHSRAEDLLDCDADVERLGQFFSDVRDVVATFVLQWRKANA